MQNKILAIIQSQQGSGHQKRMQAIQFALSSANICLDIVEYNNIKNHMADVQNLYKTIILDNRDFNFPEQILLEKEKFKLIALDNRGEGRKQADVIIDSIPHFNMTNYELKEALKNSLIHPYLFEIHRYFMSTNRNTKIENQITVLNNAKEYSFFLKKIKNKYAKKKILLQLPNHINKRLSSEVFIQKLINAEIVVTYFGQTMLDALYLKKKIYLYPISSYHLKLSKWFAQKWNNHPHLYFALSENGIEHFIREQLFIVKKN